jgi:hypothetical protein
MASFLIIRDVHLHPPTLLESTRSPQNNRKSPFPQNQQNSPFQNLEKNTVSSPFIPVNGESYLLRPSVKLKLQPLLCQGPIYHSTKPLNIRTTREAEMIKFKT